jgi:hypothetical protein
LADLDAGVFDQTVILARRGGPTPFIRAALATFACCP